MTDSDQTIIKYLLNDLSVEDQERFEEAYLVDGSLFEQVQALEAELIEDYVRGNLSIHERQLFARHYLASEPRRAKVETARQLVEVCALKAPAPPVTPPATESLWSRLRSRLRMLKNQPLALGFGVATAALLLVGLSLVLELLRLHAQLTVANDERAALETRMVETERQLAQEHERITEEREQSLLTQKELKNANSQLDRLREEQAHAQPPADQIVSLLLSPDVRDVSKVDRAVISAEIDLVELRVRLEKQEAANPRLYRVTIKTAEGGLEIWAREGIKPLSRGSARDVAVRVPVERFTATGERGFALTLSAPAVRGNDYEELANCYFQVIPK